MMKAIVVVPGQDGPTLAVQSVREPQPGPADLLVAVKAAGVNRADLRRTQQHFAGGDLDIAGLEIAGEVIGVGAGVAGFAPGDRVMGMTRDGYAERAALDHRIALRVPPTMSWTDAASIPSWYLTAHDALVTNGALQPGEALLVLGAAAGVGIATIQVAKALGAHPVIGTSREAAKLARLKELCGLDVGIDASSADIAGATKAATAGQGAALIIDNIGASTLAAAMQAAALKGRIVSVGRLGGLVGQIDLDLLALKRLRLIGVTHRTRTIEEKAALNRAFLADLWPALEAGGIRPVVDKVYPLDAALAAQEHMRGNAHLGKIVLTT